MQIKDHVFLVAGGGSGLGAATARMLAQAGGKVVVADLNDAAGWASQSGVEFAKTDVTDEVQTQAAVERCVATFGAIHGAIPRCASRAAGSPRPARRCRGSPAPSC